MSGWLELDRVYGQSFNKFKYLNGGENKLLSNSVLSQLEQVTGKYPLENSTNFENYLKELGINKVLRLFAAAAKPYVVIKGCSSNGCKWKITTKVTGLLGTTKKMKFKLETEFMDNTLDGRKVRTTIQKTNSTTLVETQRGENGEVVTILTRVFSKDAMKVTLKANVVTAHSVFKRIKE